MWENTLKVEKGKKQHKVMLIMSKAGKAKQKKVSGLGQIKENVPHVKTFQFNTVLNMVLLNLECPVEYGLWFVCENSLKAADPLRVIWSGKNEKARTVVKIWREQLSEYTQRVEKTPVFVISQSVISNVEKKPYYYYFLNTGIYTSI